MASSVYHIIKPKCRSNCLTVSPNIQQHMQKINNNTYEIKSLICRLYLDLDERKKTESFQENRTIYSTSSHINHEYTPLETYQIRKYIFFSLLLTAYFSLPFSCFSLKTTLHPCHQPFYHTHNRPKSTPFSFHLTNSISHAYVSALLFFFFQQREFLNVN